MRTIHGRLGNGQVRSVAGLVEELALPTVFTFVLSEHVPRTLNLPCHALENLANLLLGSIDYPLILLVTKQDRLFDDYVYFFYLTNEAVEDVSTSEVVFGSNARCDQENILAQLNQCRALHAPLDNLESNWAYMVMTPLAWNLKAWIGLSVPVDGRWREQHQQERRDVIRMEFKRFVECFVRLPAQIVRGARKLTVRLLSWNKSLHVFNRWLRFALE